VITYFSIRGRARRDDSEKRHARGSVKRLVVAQTLAGRAG
jgi:hypothetical protein